MKTVLKPALLAAAIAAGLLATQASHAEAPRAAAVTQQRNLAAFSAIELSGPFDVVVRAQGRQALQLSGENTQQLDQIDTFVRGDTLVVRQLERKGFHFSWGKRQAPTISITAAQLTSLKMSGSGDVDLSQLSGERLALSVDGPGDLQAAGAVRDLTLRSSGSGDVDLRRLKAANIELTQSGPGDVRLAGVGNALVASMSGSGDLDADDLRLARLDARMSGPGSMTLTGSARELRADISGSGDFEAGELAVQRATVKTRGPGDIELAQVSDTLDAELRGSGDLEARIDGKRLLLKMSGPGTARVEGKVELVKAQLSGSGALEGRGLTAGRAEMSVDGPGNAEVNVAGRRDDARQLLVVDRKGSRQSSRAP